ncbi:N-acetylmuramoyl-L-alanine amidase [Desulfotomaculum copahuensis]|uniref:N-acetylmuramoyl-L-alanine amidase n=1 Tax=Desulfotomaculum copahuensis TaxID=1838280 RepID=A0A1B7LDI8_9FIRM|nr:N-acetylmuramoyl-L-alanine amidase [Desulfotomaculum copahuensis]OAT81121.1 N-acetylmuramoyl-L-alanine amidase [Desulfotomaculum copahuensis]
MKIVIDPGHGGKDPGAVGHSGLKEANVNLQVALKVAEKLQRAGLSVKLTRTTDAFVDLQPRCDIANSWGADYFVSIHCNSAGAPQAYGTETYCYKFGGKGEVLAKAIQAELIAATGRANRGVKEANFYVLRKTSMPAVLTELAFISNLEEERLLASAAYQEKCAMAIAKGIGKVIGVDIAEQAPQPEPLQAPAADANNVIYKVQVGAFAQRENAERLAAELRSKGYNTYIVSERRNG